jgi:ubiquitin-protein ligase
MTVKSPRERRLLADFEALQQLQKESSIFSFSAVGRLPERYDLIFKGAGIQQDSQEAIVPQKHHEVRIELGAAYPRLVPNFSWITPIFHPNISQSGVVCLGGYGTHWAPSLTLSEICQMLWDMIRYQNFDPNSPYNREAAEWAKLQVKSRTKSQSKPLFPLDPRPLRNLVAEGAGSRTRPTPPLKPAVGKSRSNPTVSQPVRSGWTSTLDATHDATLDDGIQIISVAVSAGSKEADIFVIE